MPLAPNVRLAPNFTAHELGADKPTATDEIVANLTRTATGLQVVRGILGNVFMVMGPNSGYRTPAQNAAVGGSPTSDHLTGKAADFTPIGVGLRQAYDALKRAADLGTLPQFDQIILYPDDGHIHIGFGDRMRGEFRIRTAPNTYPFLTPDLVKLLPGAVGTIVVAVVATGWLHIVAMFAILFFVIIKL